MIEIYEDEINRIKGIGSWRDKFVDVFLNMVEKIPVQVDPEWNKKKRVRMGWKAVKMMIKQSLKFGVQPTTTVV